MTNPKAVEKELLTVVVHRNQFVVSARRVHQLLAPQQRYESWLQIAILQNALTQGEDYWHRERMHDAPNHKSHSIVLTLYAIKKLCTLSTADEEQEAAAQKLFHHVSAVQQSLVPACMGYLASYLVYNIDWKPLDGQRLYPVKKVLKSLQALPALELQLRQQYPQHFKTYKGKPYLSYNLVQQLHLQRWVGQNDELLKKLQPFAQLAGV